MNDTTENTTPEIEFRTIGELFKSKRISKDLNLKVISQQTKIHIGLLESLEEDRLDKLPSKTYVRGFVKACAKILSYDQEYALLLLDKTYEEKMPKKEEKVYHAPANDNKIERNINKKGFFSSLNIKSIFLSYSLAFLKYGILLTIIIVVGINLKNYLQTSDDNAKNKFNISVTSLQHRPKKKVAEKKPEVKAEIKSEEPIQINLISDAKTPPNQTLQTSKEIIVKDVKLSPAENKPLVSQFQKDSSLSKDEIDVYLPSRFRVTPPKGEEILFINATEGDSWLTYKIDNRDIQKFVLRQGRTVFMRGKNIRVFIGNTKNVKLFHNNQPVSLTDKKGTTNIVLPEELKSKYMTPLFIFQKDGSAVTSDEFVKTQEAQSKSL